MKTVWTGYYLDGRTAARQRATILPMRNALQVTTESGQKLAWPYAELRQTQGSYAGEQVRLEFGEELPEVLLVSDVSLLAALHRLAPDQTRHLHDPTRRRLRVKLTLLAGVAVVVFVALVYVWGIPGLARAAAPYIPVAWEERLGSAVVEELAPEERRCEDPYRENILNGLVATLTATTPESPYNIELIVVNDPTINAFAAPGGYVVVFRGFLERTETPEQLVGVLAHELQHILKRHTTRAILEHTSTGVLLAALSGDFSGAMTYGIGGARTLGMLKYSRTHEEEADTEGMRMLMAAGIDPNGMIAFYQVLMEKGHDLKGPWAYLSTHPRTRERIDSLKRLAEQPGRSQPVKLLPDFDWRQIRAICQAQSDQRKREAARAPERLR
jgi:predicted Zn-dependent protease